MNNDILFWERIRFLCIGVIIGVLIGGIAVQISLF